MTYADLLSMDLHETKILTAKRSVMRVVGGWVYSQIENNSVSIVFVPEKDSSKTWRKP